jgi:phosphoglycerol transferase
MPPFFSAQQFPDPLADTIGALAVLTVAGVLLATIGGFGAVFSALVSPEIRSYNRISSFVSFASITAFAFFLAYLMRRSSNRFVVSVLAIMTVVAIAEQSEFGSLKSSFEQSEPIATSSQEVVNRLEQKLPVGASVYQMPYAPYPNAPILNGAVPLESLLAYVYSHHLRWSFPALSTASVDFERRLAGKSQKEIAKRLLAAGFSAIWINRFAYDDVGAEIMRRLDEIGLPEIEHDSEGRIAVFSLAQVRNQDLWSDDDDQVGARIAKEVQIGDIIDFSQMGNSAQFIESGWSKQESRFRWTEGDRARIRLRVSAPRDKEFSIMFTASPFLHPTHPRQDVALVLNGREAGHFRFELGKPFPELRAIVDGSAIDPSGELLIELLIDSPVSPAEVGLSTDIRWLGIAVSAMSIL